MLPEAWISKIFDHMSGLYGAKFSDLWRGSDSAKVKAMWAEKLGGFEDKPKSIKAALDALDERPFPPTLPEFVTLCRDAARRIGSEHAALPHKPTPADRQRQHEMAVRLGEAIGAGNIRDGIDAHWATHPRSHTHLRAIFCAASNDARFRPCIAQMVEDGICTEEGHAVKFYRDGSWFAAGSAA